jgi:positive regulator of sigma E activity
VIGDLLDSLSGVTSELWTMLLSLAGLIIGFYWARLFSQKQAFHKDFLPKMTKVFIKVESFS